MGGAAECNGSKWVGQLSEIGSKWVGQLSAMGVSGWGS